MKAGFNSDHANMAMKLRDDLGTFVSELTNTVGGLRKEFAEDIAGASRAWSGSAPTKPRTRDKVDQPHKDTVHEISPDDLTRINGIGSRRGELLNQAGFYTFAQLAQSTPEELYRALGEPSTLGLPAVEKWIEQAKELA